MAIDIPNESAIPAATVVLMRDGWPAPELLMVERAPAMRFAAGALVFPGGRVDPGDHALAGALGAARPDEAAHRIAAIREAIEEVGVAPGVDVATDRIAPMRAALHAGAPLGHALEQVGAALRLDALEPFARWCPDHSLRVFDTRFYLARMPAGAPEPVVDASENVRLFWASARAVLASADAGEARVIYPTRRNLERLAMFGTFDEAIAHARSHPQPTITPWIETRGDGRHLCIPADIGYPVTSERLDAAMRG